MEDTQPNTEDAIAAEKHPRTAKRHRVLKTAKIVLDDWRAIDCMLRDLSETGARIRVSSTGNVPHLFRLFTATDNMIRDVQIAWKHHDEVGVIFKSPAKSCALRKF